MWKWLAPVIAVGSLAVLAAIIVLAAIVARKLKKTDNSAQEHAVVMTPLYTSDIDIHDCEQLSSEKFPLEVFSIP